MDLVARWTRLGALFLLLSVFSLLAPPWPLLEPLLAVLGLLLTTLGPTLGALRAHSLKASEGEFQQSLGATQRSLEDFARLISPAGATQLEALANQSKALTQQRFGRAIRLFAPLYLSNECINNCAYCGFSRDNPILRVTLESDEVLTEARALAEQGFRNVLLVAGEHPKFVSNGYVEQCVQILHETIPSLSLEL